MVSYENRINIENNLKILNLPCDCFSAYITSICSSSIFSLGAVEVVGMVVVDVEPI